MRGRAVDCRSVLLAGVTHGVTENGPLVTHRRFALRARFRPFQPRPTRPEITHLRGAKTDGPAQDTSGPSPAAISVASKPSPSLRTLVRLAMKSAEEMGSRLILPQTASLTLF